MSQLLAATLSPPLAHTPRLSIPHYQVSGDGIRSHAALRANCYGVSCWSGVGVSLVVTTVRAGYVVNIPLVWFTGDIRQRSALSCFTSVRHIDVTPHCYHVVGVTEYTSGAGVTVILIHHYGVVRYHRSLVTDNMRRVTGDVIGGIRVEDMASALVFGAS